MPPEAGHHASTRRCEQSPEFRKEYETDPNVRELIDIACKLEGTNRNAGTHAAGVVIANGPMTDYVPVQRVVRKDDDGGGKTARPSSRRNGSWATSKRSACSRWTSSACGR